MSDHSEQALIDESSLERPIRVTEGWDSGVVVYHYPGGVRRAFHRLPEGGLVDLGAIEETYDQPLLPWIHRSIFHKNRPRYLSSLAKYPGDPNAVVRSLEEADHKAAMQGKTRQKFQDLADGHPAHRGGAW